MSYDNAETIITADGEISYADEAIWCCGKAFSTGAAANEWAADDAIGEEMEAYVKEHEAEFGKFIGGNMELLYDNVQSIRATGSYLIDLIRQFAAADPMFYDWLGWKREPAPAEKKKGKVA